MEKFKLFTRKQEEGEKLGYFYADLRKVAKPCEFGLCEEKLIKHK